MRAATSRFRFILMAICCGLLVASAGYETGSAAAPSAGMMEYLEQRLGLNDVQVHGALGALLVFARDRLPKPEFDTLTARFPNAENMMEDAKLRGIVTRPLDDVETYEASLETLGIPRPIAAQFVQGVLDYLDSAGYEDEHDILSKVVR